MLTIMPNLLNIGLSFVIKHWKVFCLFLSCIVVGLFFLWVSSLFSKNKSLEKQVATLSADLDYSKNFIAKYESARAENENLRRKNNALIKDIQNDPNCLAPASFRKFVDQLR